MVSTRHHPRDFPPPEASPTKGSPRKSMRQSSSTASPAPESPTASPPQAKSLAKRAVSNANATASSTLSNAVSRATDQDHASPTGWSHTASNLTLLWLAISLPLVIWDLVYMLLRPHTMAGGALQWPLWKPYEIYASVDHVYGWPGWDNKDGFGPAQSVLNAVETVLYGLYGAIVYHHGVPSNSGRGLQVGEGVRGWFAGGRRVQGKVGNRALILGFAAAVMTLSKTLLYYFTEYFSGFANIKHNDWPELIFFYIIMNGLWVAFPAYMTAVFGAEILEALDIAVEADDAAAKKKY